MACVSIAQSMDPAEQSDLAPPSTVSGLLEPNNRQRLNENLSVTLTASLLERFTSLLLARPSLDVILEEVFYGLYDMVDLDFLSLLVIDQGHLVPRTMAKPEWQALLADIVQAPEWHIDTPGTSLLRPQFIDDVEAAPALGLPIPRQARSVCSLPLQRLDNVYGVLVGGRFGLPRPWSRAQQLSLTAVSRVAAVTVEQAHSAQVIERAGRETTALLTLARVLEGVTHAHQLRRSALEVLRPHFPGASLGFALFEHDAVRFVDFEGDEELAVQAGLFELRSLSDARLATAFNQGEMLFLNEYPEAPQADARWLEANVAAVAIVPLEPGRNLYARRESLVAVRRARRRPWSDLERRLLIAASRTVTVAFERIDATQALSEAHERAELLAALSDALQTTQTAEQVAQTAMEWLGPALRADNILTLRISGERVYGMGVWGSVPEAYRGYFSSEGVGLDATRLTRKIVETGEPIYAMGYNRGSNAPDPDRRRVAVGLEPIKDTFGRVVAVFSVARNPEVGIWLPEERELMERAAGTVGLALERARVREALEAQNRALEQKSAEMEAFVYSVSHDLKAPMVSLEGMSTLLMEALEAGDQDEVQFFVSRLRANVSTMAALVNNLLELSRIGRIDEDDELLDVGVVVQGALDELDKAIQDKNIQIQLPERWPLVRFPPSRLYQIWANLIGNAVKFMPSARAEGQIRIHWNQAEALEFHVWDNGVGIPAHLRGKVFDLFTRLDPSVEGTGVGLAMVKRIVESKGGSVWLEDTPDAVGIGVAFSLPLARVEHVR